MKHLFVSYDIAKKLRNMKFDQDCFGTWNLFNSGPPLISIGRTSFHKTYLESSTIWVAPTYQQVTDWFRDKHQIFIDIQTDCTSYPKFAFDIAIFTGNPKDLAEKEWGWELIRDPNGYLYRTYYEALDEAIESALKLIK